MTNDERSQNGNRPWRRQSPGQVGPRGNAAPAAGRGEVFLPNPKAKLLDQLREVMRVKHYSLRTERSYRDWVRRFVKFHGMRGVEG
jgi:hypothetical protein